MERAADSPLEDLRPEMDRATGFDIQMRGDHRPIGDGAILEDHPIQLIHFTNVIRHAEVGFPELLVIEKIDFRRRGFHDAPPILSRNT